MRNNVIRSAAFLSGTFALCAYAQSGEGAGANVAPGIEKTTPVVEGAEKLTDGWHSIGNLAGRMSLESNDKVAGQTNGTASTYGLAINVNGLWKQETQTWDNNLALTASTSKTPALGRYTKNSDSLALKSTYLFGLPSFPQVGPYARFTLGTTMFKGYNDTAEQKTYAKALQNGSAESETTNSIQLTDGFSPVTTRESLGGFYQPFDSKTTQVQTRAGFGAEQLSSGKGQFVVKDNKDTEDIELVELKDYNVLGFEAGLNASHAFSSLALGKLEADVFMPVAVEKSVAKGRSNSELTSWQVSGVLSAKLSDWLSANYEVSAKKQPLVTSDTQVRQGFFLQVNQNFL
jgi:hypothetical protein